ncbi:unnamed protein product [Cylindrotheca closterium]|uniref:Uncharacterized protein n=1 Tax=Cylindrotheca closterium TaxID=2856 RepID=A0AAD2CLV7_9STRA|nr:unnamed protein product [Cylindrotheca closterium]
MVVDPPRRNPLRTNRRRPLRFAEGIAELRRQGEIADNQEDAQAEAAPDINMDLAQQGGDDAGAGNNNVVAGEGNNNAAAPQQPPQQVPAPQQPQQQQNNPGAGANNHLIMQLIQGQQQMMQALMAALPQLNANPLPPPPQGNAMPPQQQPHAAQQQPAAMAPPVVQQPGPVQNPLPPPNEDGLDAYPRGIIPLDLKNKLELGLYNQAKQPLSNKFDGTDLSRLIKDIQGRCTLMHCLPVFDVTENAMTKNLLSKYGEISLVATQAAATSRWRTNTYFRQASYALGMCLLDSVSNEFKQRLEQREDDYVQIRGRCDGPTIFKIICNLTSPSNRRTIQFLINDLQTLSPIEHGNSIILFNQRFNELKAKIRAMGGSSSLNEVMTYNALAQGYNQVDQDEFRAFMSIKNNMPEIPHEDLMKEGETKYNNLVSEGLWHLPSQKQQIMSLSASQAKDKREIIKDYTAKIQKFGSKRKQPPTDPKQSKKPKADGRKDKDNGDFDTREGYKRRIQETDTKRRAMMLVQYYLQY